VPNRTFIAARVEARFNRAVERIARRAGWQEHIISYVGYGNHKRIRVLGRLGLQPRPVEGIVGQEVERLLVRRGWRNFFTVACVSRPVKISLDHREYEVVTDNQGYIDTQIADHGLAPGWHTVQISTPEADPTAADVLVVAKDVTFGIISDLDDTVISTYLPRPLIAAWNSLVLTENARQAVAGMSELYRSILDDHPGAPIVYVSTGAWNTLPFLRRFLHRNRFPSGPLLLTDWGPTNTGWFRSGLEHKRSALRQLARDFPKISWLLIGDDGQHDPMIYGEFAAYAPKRVRGIAIRQLNPVEQVLAHGLPLERLDTAWAEDLSSTVPRIEGPDGNTLLDKIDRVIGSGQ
jgi:phosphatidate phosphatase APP1